MEQKTRKIWMVSAAAAALILAAVYLTLFAPHRAVANLVLQVNPEIDLVIDGRNLVIGFSTEEGVLVGLDLINKEKSEVLRMIADALREAGLLGEGRRILIAINPINDRIGETELIALNSAVDQTIRGYLVEHNLIVEVKSVVITEELARAIQAVGLSPVDYVDVVVEVGDPAVLAMLGMQGELGIDPVLFKDEFSTMAAALVDMKEAGILEGDALAVLRGALIADQSLEELTTITAAMIDLHEVGAGQAEIMAVFDLLEAQLAAGADRALLLEEFTTITAAKADMLEAGIPAAAALDALRTAMQADPKLEELTTITAAMIDLVEEGVSKEEALTRIQSAIREDPTLQKFDDLIEAEPQEQERRQDRQQVPRPTPVPGDALNEQEERGQEGRIPCRINRDCAALVCPMVVGMDTPTCGPDRFCFCGPLGRPGEPGEGEY
jgi:hypothetical protein